MDFLNAIFDRQIWAQTPFHLWSVIFFVFGAMWGSFLNVCIHRMPLDQSVISPPSHCPHCKYSIPWFLNLPIITWLWLRGKCRNCGAPIAPRYLLVELLTGVAFLCAWLAFGERGFLVALAYCILLAGFIVATFIDFEHLIIPDEITLGGAAAGFLISFAVPALHGVESRAEALKASGLGIAVGAGAVYVVLRGGKLLFGRQRVKLEENSLLVFTENGMKLPSGEEIPYGEMLYRRTDALRFLASRIEITPKLKARAEDGDPLTPALSQGEREKVSAASEGSVGAEVSPVSAEPSSGAETGLGETAADEGAFPARCYWNVDVCLTFEKLTIGTDEFLPETVGPMWAVTSEVIRPREAMGLGDVKFMAAIGAFLGWQATVFSFFFSAALGSFVGLAGIFLKLQEKSSRIPYGPYIAVAAIVYLFLPQTMQALWKDYLASFAQLFRGRPPAEF